MFFRCLRSLQQYLKWQLIRKGLESKIDSWMHAHLFLFLWFHFFERDLACYRTSLDLLGRPGRMHRFVKNTLLCGFSVLLLFNLALPRCPESVLPPPVIPNSYWIFLSFKALAKRSCAKVYLSIFGMIGEREGSVESTEDYPRPWGIVGLRLEEIREREFC